MHQEMPMRAGAIGHREASGKQAGAGYLLLPSLPGRAQEWKAKGKAGLLGGAPANVQGRGVY